MPPSFRPGLRSAFRQVRIPGPGAPAASAPALAGAQSQFTPLPARPFAVAVTRAGDRAFVSFPRPDSRGVGVLSAGEPWELENVVWVAPDVVPRGIAVDEAGRYILIANGAGGLLVAQTARLAAHEPGPEPGNPFALVLKGPGNGSMQVTLDPSERFAFVTDEDSATLSVFDFGGSLRSTSTSPPAATLLGAVRLPPGPVGIAQSPDRRWLCVTSQGGGRGDSGVLSVLNVEEVVNDPARTRPMASVPAGASPVRVAVSPSGEVVWVTARASNSLIAFDAESLTAGRRRAPRAIRAVVAVGATPVGVSTVRGGSLVLVANSNRYGADAEQPQTLSVIDAQAALTGKTALIGTIAAGAFPRELATLPDDQTVLVTNVFSQSLQAVRVVP